MAPAYSEKQRRFMGAELARKRRGQKTQTGMDEKQLRDFARKPEPKCKGKCKGKGKCKHKMPKSDRNGFY